MTLNVLVVEFEEGFCSLTLQHCFLGPSQVCGGGRRPRRNGASRVPGGEHDLQGVAGAPCRVSRGLAARCTGGRHWPSKRRSGPGGRARTRGSTNDGRSALRVTGFPGGCTALAVPRERRLSGIGAQLFQALHHLICCRMFGCHTRTGRAERLVKQFQGYICFSLALSASLWLSDQRSVLDPLHMKHEARRNAGLPLFLEGPQGVWRSAGRR